MKKWIFGSVFLLILAIGGFYAKFILKTHDGAVVGVWMPLCSTVLNEGGKCTHSESYEMSFYPDGTYKEISGDNKGTTTGTWKISHGKLEVREATYSDITGNIVKTRNALTYDYSILNKHREVQDISVEKELDLKVIGIKEYDSTGFAKAYPTSMFTKTAPAEVFVKIRDIVK